MNDEFHVGQLVRLYPHGRTFANLIGLVTYKIVTVNGPVFFNVKWINHVSNDFYSYSGSSLEVLNSNE